MRRRNELDNASTPRIVVSVKSLGLRNREVIPLDTHQRRQRTRVMNHALLVVRFGPIDVVRELLDVFGFTVVVVDVEGVFVDIDDG